MPHPTDRRAFLAATALAVPALAVTRVPAATRTTKDDDTTDFEHHITSATQALDHLRRPMRAIDDLKNRADAAMLANAITIHLANATKHADQAQPPEHADHERSVNDLRLELTRAVSAANALSRQLWLGHTAEPKKIYQDVQSNINTILQRFLTDG